MTTDQFQQLEILELAKPCPQGTPRERFADWQSQGRVPRGVPACTLAKGYRRVFGVNPPYHPDHPGSRAYTSRELELSLNAIGKGAKPGKKPVSMLDQIRESFNRQWEPNERSLQMRYDERASAFRKVILLEIALKEAVKPYVPEEVVDEIAEVLVEVRLCGNLHKFVRAHSKFKDNLKIRQLLFLVRAIYKYNRNIIFGDIDSNHSKYKSEIKYATACSECGSTANMIKNHLLSTKAVVFPD